MQPSLSLLTRHDLGSKRGKVVRPQKAVVGAHMMKSSECQLTIGCTCTLVQYPGLLLRPSVFLRLLLRLNNMLHNTHRGAGVESEFTRLPLPPYSTTTQEKKAWKASWPQAQSSARPLTQPPLDFLEATSSKAGSSSPGWIPTTEKLP